MPLYCKCMVVGKIVIFCLEKEFHALDSLKMILKKMN